jgi:NADP-dependent 3-hydroxy acid dehydrogenase YdfG
LAGGVLSSDESQWQDVYQTNVIGTAHLLRKAGQHLADRQSGDIVVIGSVSGRNISPFSGFYGSSKFAVGAVAEALRQEVCAKGVRVSTVLPGIVVSGSRRSPATPRRISARASRASARCSPRRMSRTAWRGCSRCRRT